MAFLYDMILTDKYTPRKFDALKQSASRHLEIRCGFVRAVETQINLSNTGVFNKVEISFEEYQWLDVISEKVMSNFVSVDIARKEDGGLIIVEFGEG